MHHFDLIGSFVVGGLLLLAILGLMFYVNMSAHSNNMSQIEQRNLTEFGRVVEYDFNKLGYRVAFGNRILAMDSTSISFLADLDNDGAVDSISYFRSGTRPKLFLTRHTSLAPQGDFTLSVADFSLQGYDQDGQPTLNGTMVQSIEFKLLLQKSIDLKEQTDLVGAYWIRRFYPKNL